MHPQHRFEPASARASGGTAVPNVAIGPGNDGVGTITKAGETHRAGHRSLGD